jgi:Ca-activated chloride channel family protein
MLDKIMVTLGCAGLILVVTSSTVAQDGLGGARSNGNIREQINYGQVPYPEAFAIEGMLSEHNFPVREERCSDAFCVLAAMGHGIHRPSDTRSAYLFVEPISGLDPDTFERAPQNLSVVIDRSGSMSGWKMASVLEATHALIRNLDSRDRLSIVAFDTEAELMLPSTPVRNKRRLHDIVDRIFSGGTTNIHDAMKMGFEQTMTNVSEYPQSRVIIMTDEQPNVGDTSKNGFLELTGRYAKTGVALSILGIGLDLGTDLAFSVSQLEGGSYHYLESQEQVERLFGSGFASFLTPVAKKLVIRVNPGSGLRVADVYGVPEDQVMIHPDGSVVLRAATVFYDERRSGVVLRLEPDQSIPCAALHSSAEITWSYLLASDNTRHRGRATAKHRAQSPTSIAEFESADQYRGYALVNFAQLLKKSLTLWHDNHRHGAISTLHSARSVLDLDAWIIQDRELHKEKEMADRLLALMVEP